MNVIYRADMRYPFPPGRELVEEEMAVEDLPPLAKRAIARDGLEACLKDWFLWESLDMTIWWSVRLP